MVHKNLIVLILTSLVLVGAWFAVTYKQRASSPGKPDQFIQTLLKGNLEGIKRVTFGFNGDTFDLEKKDETWVLPSRQNYPADQQLVNGFLIKVSELDILEQKTALKDNHPQLHLEAAKVKGSNSVEVSFINNGEKPLLDLIIGKKGPGKSFYARLSDQDQTWLVNGDLGLEPKQEAWIDHTLLSIKRPRIKRAVLSQGITIERPSPEQEDFTLLNPPKDKKLKTGYWINSIPYFLEKVEIEDVIKADALKQPSVQTSVATFTTFDGLLVTVTLLKSGKDSWVKVSASFDEKERATPAPKEGEKNPETQDIGAEAKLLNDKCAGWLFKLSSYKLEKLETKMADLIEVEPKKTKKGEVPLDDDA